MTGLDGAPGARGPLRRCHNRRGVIKAIGRVTAPARVGNVNGFTTSPIVESDGRLAYGQLAGQSVTVRSQTRDVNCENLL